MLVGHPFRELAQGLWEEEAVLAEVEEPVLEGVGISAAKACSWT